MGEAKRRGTFEQRKAEAIAAGRDKDKPRFRPSLLTLELRKLLTVRRAMREANKKAR